MIQNMLLLEIPAALAYSIKQKLVFIVSKSTDYSIIRMWSLASRLVNAP